MSVAKGRQAFILQNTPVNERPINEAEGNGISRGRAMFRARHEDRAARSAIAEAAELSRADDPGDLPPAA